jgi:hypothetical protein
MDEVYRWRPKWSARNARPRTLRVRWGHTHAVLPDGNGFLFVSNTARPDVRELRVVLNWFEELKHRVP